MVPVELRITNFLSYRKTVILDFEGIGLACIAGENGAGKSSLLDAMTWVLFGKCRAPGRDDVVNRIAAMTGGDAVISLKFALGDRLYRVVRQQPAGRTGSLEFQVVGPSGWRPMTEATMKDTQARIEQALRMDYETFTNASFLLQGRADEFTVKRPGERKRILGDLLGVGRWEVYKAEATRRRKELDYLILSRTGTAKKLEEHAAGRPTFVDQLAESRDKCQAKAAECTRWEMAVKVAREYEAAATNLRESVKMHEDALRIKQGELTDSKDTIKRRGFELDKVESELVDADVIEEHWQRLSEIREALKVATEKRDEWRKLDSQLNLLVVRAGAKTERLKLQIIELENQKTGTIYKKGCHAQLEASLHLAKKKVAKLEARMNDKSLYEDGLSDTKEDLAALRETGRAMKAKKEKYEKRLAQLEDDEEGGRCPLCGQLLTPDHRKTIWEEIEDARENAGFEGAQIIVKIIEMEGKVAEFIKAIAEFDEIETDLVAERSDVASLGERLKGLEDQIKDWNENGDPELVRLKEELEARSYRTQEDAEIAELEGQMAELEPYRTQYDELTEALEELHGADAAYTKLERDRVRHQSLVEALTEDEGRAEIIERAVADVEERLKKAQADVTALGPPPDVALGWAENCLLESQDEKSLAERDLGRAQQELDACEEAERQLKDTSAELKNNEAERSVYSALETAFGRNGVQALLIERAVPVLEDDANDLLDRLTGGRMRVAFKTQRQLKSRDAMAETLDIVISDEQGERAYEMYSGGEAFRVNFAIRVALSKMLSRRTGASLRTLVIDEGFGSQDPEGQQKLVGAIHAISGDFERVLVVTHVEELREAFPTLIEVTKGVDGSMVTVI